MIFPMSIIFQVAFSFQTSFFELLHAIVRRTFFIQRQRKFSFSTFFKTLFLTVLKSPNPKTDDLVATAAQLCLTLMSYSFDKRFTPRLLTFLRAFRHHLLEHTFAADPFAIPFLDRSTTVEIVDITTVTVPDDYADEFPGFGVKAYIVKASVKIHLRFDLRTVKFTKLLFEPVRHIAAASEASEDLLTPVSL